MVNRNETGKDGRLAVSGDSFPFTNGSYSITASTTNSDFNDERGQSTATTSEHASGSIEIDGSNVALRNKFLRDDGFARDIIRLQFTLSEGGMRFTEVTLNEYNREIPADDKTSATIDWEADNWRPL
jgi:hypothetical protein